MIRNKINCLFSSVAYMLVCAMLLLTGCVKNPLDLDIGEIYYSESNKAIHFGEKQYKVCPVQGDIFVMGDSDEETLLVRPVHRVSLSSYSIGQTEVTRELWDAVMGTYTSFAEEENIPITNVSWDECQEFINKLNQLTGRTFRLATEAEWEFAARGGNKTKGYIYSGSNILEEVGWYSTNAETLQPIAGKKSNELGLYDMSGNVAEWCYDNYGAYSKANQTNPQGATAKTYRVVRGGSYKKNSGRCSVTYRESYKPTDKAEDLGFRIVLSSNTNDAKVFPTYNVNGHEYVDLGLPSGVVWATCNLGAHNPEEFGDLYAWGELSPKDSYTWDNYKWGGSIDEEPRKYNSTDYLHYLELCDDAANVKLGGDWRIPTYQEWQELIDACTAGREWIGGNDYAYTLTNIKNGESLLFPLPIENDPSAYYKLEGLYWASETMWGWFQPAHCLYIYYTGSSMRAYIDYRARCLGGSIRPVCSPRK